MAWAAIWMLSCAELPADPRLAEMVERAQVALRDQVYRDALAWADSALALDKSNADAQFIRGRVYFELGQLEESRQAYEAVLKAEPDYPGASHNLGNALFGQSKYQLALRAYRRETGLGTRPNPYHAMGATFEKLSESDSARKAYQIAIAIDSTYVPAMVSLAEHFATRGDVENAVAFAKRAHALRPGDADTELLLGRLLVREGSFEQAVFYLEKGVQHRPWDHGALYALGQANQGLGLEGKARTVLQRADSMRAVVQQIDRLAADVRSYPTSFEHHIRYARALRISGRIDEAINAYLVALALRPHNLDLQNNLGAARMQRGDRSLAVARFRQILAQDSTYVPAWVSLGWHYWLTKNQQAAVDAWAMAARYGPGHPAVLALQSQLRTIADQEKSPIDSSGDR